MTEIPNKRTGNRAVNPLPCFVKSCEHYRCKSCGKPMISVNFVNGVCIQVFVSHDETCRCFLGNAFRRTTEVTCETCRFYRQAENDCVYEGAEDKTMERVRTGMF